MELTIEEQKAYRDEQVSDLLRPKPKKKPKRKSRAKAKEVVKAAKVPDDAQPMWTPELAMEAE